MRSALDTLVELKRNALEQLELELARLRNRQASSRRRAQELREELAVRQQRLTASAKLSGAALRSRRSRPFSPL